MALPNLSASTRTCLPPPLPPSPTSIKAADSLVPVTESKFGLASVRLSRMVDAASGVMPPLRALASRAAAASAPPCPLERLIASPIASAGGSSTDDDLPLWDIQAASVDGGAQGAARLMACIWSWTGKRDRQLSHIKRKVASLEVPPLALAACMTSDHTGCRVDESPGAVEFLSVSITRVACPCSAKFGV